eukprot:7383439-Prymnesium_polylepis.2
MNTSACVPSPLRMPSSHAATAAPSPIETRRVCRRATPPRPPVALSANNGCPSPFGNKENAASQ